MTDDGLLKYEGEDLELALAENAWEFPRDPKENPTKKKALEACKKACTDVKWKRIEAYCDEETYQYMSCRCTALNKDSRTGRYKCQDGKSGASWCSDSRKEVVKIKGKC